MESHFRTRQILSFPNELEDQRSCVMMCTTSALLGFGNTFNKVQMLECIAKNNCNSLQELFLPNLHSESGYIMCHQSLSRTKGSIKMQFRDESWRLTAVRQKTVTCRSVNISGKNTNLSALLNWDDSIQPQIEASRANCTETVQTVTAISTVSFTWREKKKKKAPKNKTGDQAVRRPLSPETTGPQHESTRNL